MGCDIHLIVEHRNGDGTWHRVPHFDRPCDYCDGTGRQQGRDGERECYSCKGRGHNIQRHYDNRDYDVFAMLADVRNGYGFAGVDTGDGFLPLTVGRGLPDDLSAEAQANLRRDGDSDDDYDWEDPDNEKNEWAYDLGEHSFTWLTWDELQDGGYWARTTKHRGVVGAEEYATWKRKGRPGSWSGSVEGGRVIHVSHQEMEVLAKYNRAESAYTTVEWEETYGEAAAHFRKRIAAVVERVGNPAPEDVRLVMGFDS